MNGLKVFTVVHEWEPGGLDTEIYLYPDLKDMVETLSEEAEAQREVMFAADPEHPDDEDCDYFFVKKSKLFAPDFDWYKYDRRCIRVVEEPLEPGHVYSGRYCC